MPLVTDIGSSADLPAKRVAVVADRYTLEKRRWRIEADDGTDIAVDLESPCHHGDIILSTDSCAYYIQQKIEPVVEIPLPASAPEAAQLGWFLGNQHLQVEIVEHAIRLAQDSQLVAKLNRAGIAFKELSVIFNPEPHSHHHH